MSTPVFIESRGRLSGLGLITGGNMAAREARTGMSVAPPSTTPTAIEQLRQRIVAPPAVILQDPPRMEKLGGSSSKLPFVLLGVGLIGIGLYAKYG